MTPHDNPTERKPLIAGNWKMNMDHNRGAALLQEISENLAASSYDLNRVDIAVFPPFTTISTVQALIQDSGLRIAGGGQDLSPQDSGAFTGDISGHFLVELGCTYVLVGHSERRTIHHESDALLSDKLAAAYRHNLTPILCIGEGLAIRQTGKHVDHTLEQLRAVVKGLTPDQASKLVIAYEPVWAIGTGEVAGPDDAQEMCAAIRAELSDLFSSEIASSTRILYGGSVKASNAAAILSENDVDGALVGGASLDASEFIGIASAS